MTMYEEKNGKDIIFTQHVGRVLRMYITKWTVHWNGNPQTTSIS